MKTDTQLLRYLFIGSELEGIFNGTHNVKQILLEELERALKQDQFADKKLPEKNIEDYVKEIKNCNGFIICADTKDKLKEYELKNNELTGILVAQKLRFNNLTAPIVFTSDNAREGFCSNIPERKIINAIGHEYIRRHAGAKKYIDLLNTMRPLSQTELRDVQLFSCTPEGMIKDICHHLSHLENYLHQGVLNKTQIKQEFIVRIEEIHNAFKVSFNDVVKEFEKKFSDINRDNINDAIIFLKETGEALIQKYSGSSSSCINTLVKEKPWKLLLLDDEITAEDKIVQLLSFNGIEVICTKNAEQATEKLTKEDDLRGKISVIMIDYRLNEPKDNTIVQQKDQGYTFLQNIGSRFQSKLLSAVVYSGMPRQFLLETYRTYRIRTEIYSKVDFSQYNDRALNHLVTRISEIGDENYDAMLALPLGNQGWKNHLHKWYIKFRSLTDYESREREICDYCADWKEQFETGDKPPTPMIKGDAFAPGKNEPELKTIERFESYYKTRRLAQYLYCSKERKEGPRIFNVISNILMPKTKKKTTAAIKGFFSQVLGLSLSEFPFGATIEELCWFDYDLKVPVLNNYKRFRAKMEKCEELIGDYISRYSSLSELINKNNFEIIMEEEKKDAGNIKEKHKNRVLFFDRTNSHPVFFDKLDIGFCIEWLEHNHTNSDKQSKDAFIELLVNLDKIWK